MSMLYTSGDLHVKEGKEQAFVEAWQELADWTVGNLPGCAFAKLLRDDSDARHFVSFSPWRDAEAIAVWRDHPGLQQRVGYLQELLESFTPRTLTLAAEVGPPTPDP